jgi:pimeloyl-ACP methyl ester carboxylesterase
VTTPQLTKLAAPYGVELELIDTGTGSPVLVLHEGTGLVSDAAFLGMLAEAHRVIAPSHPGFGGSTRPGNIDSVDDLAYFYLDLLDQLGIDECALVGCCFGGWIAAELAVRSPGRFSHLVLVDSVGIRVATAPTEPDFADIWAVSYADLATRSAVDPEVRRRLFGFAEMSNEQAVAWTRNNDALALYAWQPYLHSPKLRSRLSRIRASTIVLWGAADRIADPAYGRAFAESIPGAEFEIIRDAAHLPHLEQPKEFSLRVKEFLS